MSIKNISKSFRIAGETHAKQRSKMHGQNAELLVLLDTRGVTSGLERAKAVCMLTGCFSMQQSHYEASVSGC